MPDEPGNPPEIVNPQDFRATQIQMKSRNQSFYSVVAVRDNIIIGINRLYIDKNGDSKVWQNQIGVREDMRNKGIAKWMLASIYDKILSSYPQISEIYVDTHPSNKPMRNVLSQFGFQYQNTEYI